MIHRKWDDSTLVFREAGHVYELSRSGQATISPPSVSTIANYNPDKPPVNYPEGAATRGTRIHRCLELHEIGELDPEYERQIQTLKMGIFLEAWKDYLKSRPEWSLLEAEVPLWAENKNLTYVGMCDRIYIADGKLILADLKTSPRKSPGHALQVAAYAFAFQQREKKKIDEIMSIHLCEKKGEVAVLERSYDFDSSFEAFDEKLSQWYNDHEDVE